MFASSTPAGVDQASLPSLIAWPAATASGSLIIEAG
jgi:hypothetical protein